MNNRNYGSDHAEELKSKSKACRKEIQKVRAISKNKVIKLLRDLKDKSPKRYWRILKDKKRDNINVPIAVFKEHFANLAVNFESNIDSDVVPPFADVIRSLNTSALNQPFTETEIRNFVKSLKNNKSAGIDGILNEFIKHTIDILITLYVKLFNNFLDTGDLPEDWLTGLTIPIYKNQALKIRVPRVPKVPTFPYGHSDLQSRVPRVGAQIFKDFL